MSTQRRFGTGVTSLPLGVRVAVSAPFVLLEVGLVRAFVSNVQDEVARPGAAFNLFAMGVVAAVAVPVLRQVWRSTEEWHRMRSREALEARDTADRLREREGLAHFAAFDSVDSDSRDDPLVGPRD